MLGKDQERSKQRRLLPHEPSVVDVQPHACFVACVEENWSTRRPPLVTPDDPLLEHRSLVLQHPIFVMKKVTAHRARKPESSKRYRDKVKQAAAELKGTQKLEHFFKKKE